MQPYLIEAKSTHFFKCTCQQVFKIQLTEAENAYNHACNILLARNRGIRKVSWQTCISKTAVLHGPGKQAKDAKKIWSQDMAQINLQYNLLRKVKYKYI